MNGSQSFQPIRRRLDFPLVDHNYPDEWYELEFAKLFVEIWNTVHLAFSPEDSHHAPTMSPWLRSYSKEFIKYVELVAHPDARSGKWEKLLRDRDERSNLLEAVIFKILDTHIFSQLLFGADPKHAETLQNADTALIATDGFSRSKLRSHTTKNWLQTSNGIPPRFWEEVDKLCVQTLTMLLPVYGYTSMFTGYEPISIEQLYQKLHNLIALAGWLSVTIRMSPAIFSFSWAKPGELFSMNQVNRCQSAYKASMEVAQRYHTRLMKEKPNSKPMKSAARIKISVFPEIVRHRPVPKVMNNEGVTSYKILEPHVLYYQGLQLEHDEERAFISLPDYIKKLEDRNIPRYAALAIMGIVFTLLWVYFTTSGQQTWHSIQQWMKSGLEHIMRPRPESTPVQEQKPEPWIRY
ncbi:hypothetical protein F53441_9048 [Fusarium austroafricanum]|uniref:Uncharacterized protein n=1 Tax=Fusarium austroafricanum TaxID=2364996 RepID=A0A8H4P3X4_9HYPO|nr:hypothetical protein F53441_9048 [Fusarium austroafricanum]